MSHPRKGEGEHSTPSNKHKGQSFFKTAKKMPPLFAVAILVGLPICLASLSASPAYAETSLQRFPQQNALLQAGGSPLSQGLYAASLQESIPQSLGTLHQLRNQPKSYPGLLLPYSAPQLPSSLDLNNLESTLSNLKSKVAYLKTQRVSPDIIANLEQQIADLEDSIKLTKRALGALQTAQEALKASQTDLQAAQTAYDAKVAQKQQTEQALTAAQAQKAEAQTALEAAQAAYSEAQQLSTNTSNQLSTQLAIKEQAQAALTDASIQLTQAEQTLIQAQTTFNEASARLTQLDEILQNKQLTFNEAQTNYNTNLIPDPNWTHPTYQQERTRQVPVTTTTTTGGLTATTYNRNGYNNAPPMPSDNETPLSTQTVTHVDFQWGGGPVLNSGRSEDVIVKFTGYIQVPTSNYYHFYAPADDGTRLYINNILYIDDWYDKGGGGSTSQAVYLTAGQAVPITFYYYENGGGASVSLQYYTYDAPYYQIAPAAWFGTQTQTTTTYVTETYYTTELVPGATAPLIKNPALLPALNTAQANLTEAQQAYDAQLLTKNQAQQIYSSSQTSYEQASTQQLAAEQTLQTELATFRDIQTSNEAATTQLAQAQESKAIASTSYEAVASEVATTEQTLATTTEEVVQAEQTVQAKTASAQTAAQEVTKAETTSEQIYTRTTQKAQATSNEVESTIPEPDPTEVPSETGSADLPAEITADNLLTTDLSQVDPTEMTPEQAEQLKEAALEVFLTAEEGSEAYEQALDALYLAAEQDDIVLDPTLAAIPGLAAATELVNFFGNAGADMSPKKREESEKVVVATVVAAGAAIQSAAAAAAGASGSTTRRN